LGGKPITNIVRATPTEHPVVLNQPATPETHAILSGPASEVILRVFQVTGFVGTAVVVAEVVILGPLSSTYEALQAVLRLLMTIFGIGGGLSKRRKPWGSVYDSQTKRPLDPAIVTLLDEDGTELDSSITDLNGRYGFLTTAGTYRLKAGKTNYVFPSSKLKGKKEDEVYANLYFGENMDIMKGAVIGRNIPLDPVAFDWNEYAKKDQKLISFYGRHILGINHVTGTLFAAGITFSTVAAIVTPSIFNIAILCAYVILFFIRIGTHKAYGQIIDGATGKPLPFALVEVSIPGTVISKKATDILGRYYCLVSPGIYRLSVDKKNPDGSYTNVSTTNPFRARRIINKRVVV
jgi:hypothetical protein